MIAPAMAATVSQIAPKARGKSTDPPRLFRREAADRKRRGNGFIGSNARADQRVDKVKRFLVAFASYEIDRPAAPRSDIGTREIVAARRAEHGRL
jgi:hypothetical protein